MEVKPIAYVENDFNEKFGVPRQSGRAPSVISKIVFYPPYNDQNALRGIQEFSHLWLIFDFSLSHGKEFTPLIRPPRLGGNKKVGVFASRSPFRPNSMGLSCVKLLGVEEGALIVSGADLVNGTPILDVKPYIPFTDCRVDAVGSYADQNKDYKLNVVIPPDILALIPTDKVLPLTECLSDDPRPSYQDDDREYGMAFSNFNVKFIVKDKTLTITKVQLNPIK